LILKNPPRQKAGQMCSKTGGILGILHRLLREMGRSITSNFLGIIIYHQSIESNGISIKSYDELKAEMATIQQQMAKERKKK
jgi:hypothetical protein